MITYVEGNLLHAPVDIMVHGCNCFNTMKSGIAKQIARRYPMAAQVDSETIKGSRDKLGTFTHVKYADIVVVNAYTQYDYGRDGKERFNYIAFRHVLKKLNSISPHNDPTIGFPKIGAGLAGGDWDQIERIIEEELKDYKVYVYTM